MNKHFPFNRNAKHRVLVVPLDWGLGHATRCIPIIRELLLQGADVWVAGEGLQAALLKQEFPGLPLLPLRGYRVRYAKTVFGFTWKIIAQIPHIFKTISYENLWLQKVVNDYRPDVVISDNRYGLYHPGIKTVFITHQLMIKCPGGKWLEKILQKKNYQYINRFSECWVPDYEGEECFAGELSHPSKMPNIPVKYVGLLTRFSKTCATEKKGHLLFLLSGPEPQRSILEGLCIQNLDKYSGTVTVVRGLPGHATGIPSTEKIQFYNHLPADKLTLEMQKAEFIISRSGYTTVMDAMAHQKKCIFIPTPGQTEQEYLAQYLMKKRLAYCVSQHNFCLASALQAARNFNYTIPVIDKRVYLAGAVAGLLA